jgi:hypothetical protein
MLTTRLWLTDALGEIRDVISICIFREIPELRSGPAHRGLIHLDPFLPFLAVLVILTILNFQVL